MLIIGSYFYFSTPVFGLGRPLLTKGKNLFVDLGASNIFVPLADRCLLRLKKKTPNQRHGPLLQKKRVYSD
jgi:hypothetical protein